MVQEDSKILITIVEARNLKAADIGGTSDPYVVIKDVHGLHMPGKQVKTSIKKKTLSPVWNEAFSYTANYKLHKLVFKVFDHDMVGSDDHLGKVVLSVEKFFDGQEHDNWFPVILHKKPHGELRIRVKIETAYPIVFPGAWQLIQSRSLHLGLGWDTKKSATIDLDASVVALDEHKQVLDNASFGHKVGFNGGLAHQGDNRTGEGKGDDEVIFLDLAKVPPQCTYLVFTINCFSNQPLSTVKSSYCRLLSKDNGQTLAFTRLSPTEPKTGLVFGLLRKNPADGWWTFYVVSRAVEGRTWSESIPHILQFI